MMHMLLYFVIVVFLLTLSGFTSSFIKALLGKSETRKPEGKPSSLSSIFWLLACFPVGIYLLWKE